MLLKFKLLKNSKQLDESLKKSSYKTRPSFIAYKYTSIITLRNHGYTLAEKLSHLITELNKEGTVYFHQLFQ